MQKREMNQDPVKRYIDAYVRSLQAEQTADSERLSKAKSECVMYRAMVDGHKRSILKDLEKQARKLLLQD